MDGLYIMENPMNKWDDLGVPLFLETSKWLSSSFFGDEMRYGFGFATNAGLF